MKAVLAFFAGVTLFSTAAHADFKSFIIKPESEFSLPAGCVGSNNRIQLKGERVSIVKESGEIYSLGLDEQSEDLPIFFGSNGSSDACVMAIKYAENDVNESFSLFIFNEGADKYKASAIHMITNPEFAVDKISSSYNDGPVTHNDKLCYSRKTKDYYACEKREQFSEKLEKKQECSELSCSDSQIVKENTSEPVSAVIVPAKAYLSNKNDDSKFVQRKAYLVEGDEVTLSDFFQGDDGLYYKIIYVGSTKTVGWVSSRLLRIKD
jgi:hypothetical protein